MSGLYESASALMRIADRQIDSVAHNVSNLQTPGYKRSVAFANMISGSELFNDTVDLVSNYTVMRQGKMISSGNSLDFAIEGEGFFAVRNGDVTVYSRQGQFHRDADGRLIDGRGYALQQVGGGDIAVDDSPFSLADDGTMIVNGRPVARVATYAPERADQMTPVGEAHFAADSNVMAPVDSKVRQNMLEASNVTLGDEMVSMMAAMRRAETGAKLMQMYDEMLGQALSKLGQGGQ